MAKQRRLTIKQEKFVLKYLECGNASEAYRFAYDCSKMSDSTVWANASRLLNDSKVIARLEYLRNNLAEAAGISALQIIREHQKIAFSNFSRLRNGWMELKDFQELSDEEKACIQSVETKKTTRYTKEGDPIEEEWVKIRLYDKQKALDSIVNMLGYNAPEKMEHSGKDGKAIEIDATINYSELSDSDLLVANNLVLKALNGRPGK